MTKKESFILVHAGESPAPEIIQLESEHLLDGMYQAIHCDCIEIVRVQTGLLLFPPAPPYIAGCCNGNRSGSDPDNRGSIPLPATTTITEAFYEEAA